jgi:hypothetical protein
MRDFGGKFEKAGEGTRTLDIQLGKLALCQLSYARNKALQTSAKNTSAVAFELSAILASAAGSVHIPSRSAGQTCLPAV